MSHPADQSKPNIPWPEGHGWETFIGKLTTKWSEADLMPQELIGVLVSEDPHEVADQEEEAVLLDLPDVIFE